MEEKTRKIIASGAEAVIVTDDSKKSILKCRVKKEYRLKEIDEKLRSTRTRREAGILNKLMLINFPSPRVINVNDKTGKIEMEFLSGSKVRDILEKKEFAKKYLGVCKEIGKKIAMLHNNDIMHGDLTTSNMILHKGSVYLIDFGLSYFSERVEDRAVDLHLLRQALESKHCRIWEKAYKVCLNGYISEAKKADDVLKRLEVVENRGRYKGKGS